jgi:hypothetical protein
MSDKITRPETDIVRPLSFRDKWTGAGSAEKAFTCFISGSALLTLFTFCIGQFFQIRGVQHMMTSRFFLASAWLILVAGVWGVAWVRWYEHRWRITITAALILLLVAFLIDRAFPMPKTRATLSDGALKHAPLITIKIHPASFPVSVPSHSTLYILPLHPFQTFTDAASHLHEFGNSCSEEHLWPTQKEIGSRPANSYEEVRKVELTNHSQDTMESGRIVFTLAYNESFAGGCVAPPKSAQTQNDVIFIPALDPGKTFEFVAVNQTAGCAWLLPPDKITLKMASDETAAEIPLKIEPTVVANWMSTPFGPTVVKWEGVPTKNPGYGMVSSGADCKSSSDDERKKREIQRQLAHLMNDGNRLRVRWMQVMGQPEENQRGASMDIPYWHAKIENYIRTLPRSDVYLAKLNSASRTDFGYPLGINT